MSHTVSSSDPDNRRNRRAGARIDGATPVAGEPARRRWLLPLLAALAVLALILLLSRCGNDSTPAARPSASPSASVSVTGSGSPSASDTATESMTGTPTESASASMSASPSDTASATAGGGATGATGTITTGGTTVLGDGSVQDLNEYTGDDATARAVTVQSVPTDEGFWVGADTTNRVWVQLTGSASESGYTVKTGDTVNFTGRITPAPAGFADQVGLTAAEGADQLTAQKQYIAVDKSELQLSS